MKTEILENFQIFIRIMTLELRPNHDVNIAIKAV